MKEALGKLAEQFASERHVGAKFVADFDEVTDREERDRIQRDAFERVQYLVEKLARREVY